jgi:hypothetical protein
MKIVKRKIKMEKSSLAKNHLWQKSGETKTKMEYMILKYTFYHQIILHNADQVN